MGTEWNERNSENREIKEEKIDKDKEETGTGQPPFTEILRFDMDQLSKMSS